MTDLKAKLKKLIEKTNESIVSLREEADARGGDVYYEGQISAMELMNSTLRKLAEEPETEEGK